MYHRFKLLHNNINIYNNKGNNTFFLNIDYGTRELCVFVCLFIFKIYLKQFKGIRNRDFLFFLTHARPMILNWFFVKHTN